MLNGKLNTNIFNLVSLTILFIDILSNSLVHFSNKLAFEKHGF